MNKLNTCTRYSVTPNPLLPQQATKLIKFLRQKFPCAILVVTHWIILLHRTGWLQARMAQFKWRGLRHASPDSACEFVTKHAYYAVTSSRMIGHTDGDASSGF